MWQCDCCCCCCCCQVPIFVSETGVSDPRHELRARCINSYYDEVGSGQVLCMQSWC
jgi:hypothetical protein